MNYNEIFVRLKDDFAHKNVELLEDLTKSPLQIPELEEMILAKSMTDTEAIVRKAAIKFIEKNGSEIHKTVLINFPKKRYDQQKVANNFKNEIESYKQFSEFNLTLFSKYLYLFGSFFRDAQDYFLENATSEELQYFFRNNFYKKYDGDKISFFMGTQYTINANVAQELWNATKDLSENITSIDFSTKGLISMEDVPQMPNIYKLAFRCEMEQFPVGIFKLESLEKLTFGSNLNKIPNGIHKLQKLKSLSINVPLKELPADLFQLTNLEELYLWNTEITEISPEISALVNLKTLHIEDSNAKLKIIPKAIYELPKLNDIYKKMIRADFEARNEYEKILFEFEHYIKAFDKIPLVQKYLNNFREGNMDKFPEVLLAATKCYYDDAHGLEIYRFYEDIRKSKAPDTILEVNEALKKIKFIDERTTENQLNEMKKKVADFDWFDSVIFFELITEMVDYTNKLYPFEKW